MLYYIDYHRLPIATTSLQRYRYPDEPLEQLTDLAGQGRVSGVHLWFKYVETRILTIQQMENHWKLTVSISGMFVLRLWYLMVFKPSIAISLVDSEGIDGNHNNSCWGIFLCGIIKRKLSLHPVKDELNVMNSAVNVLKKDRQLGLANRIEHFARTQSHWANSSNSRYQLVQLVLCDPIWSNSPCYIDHPPWWMVNVNVVS